MTHYGASDLGGLCVFDRTHASLPDFVRQGMTVALAEPFLGSSYGGDPGEACGECWEIDTGGVTQMVMVHDICPDVEGSVCDGGHFHFDVSDETAEALGGGWLGEAAVRAVPCPVTGSIQVRVASRNQWGYVQLSFFNQRLPIRSIEYRAADGDAWTAMERNTGRWVAGDTSDPFSDDGPGVVFRIISADDSVSPVESEVFPYSVGQDAVFDTGVQFAEIESPAGACEFVPPGDVYDDGYGGIDGVRWEGNAWNDQLREISKQCADSSSSCLLQTNFGSSGLHLTYRSPFPVDTFSTLSLQLRAQSGDGGTISVAPRSEEETCSNSPTVRVTSEWTRAEIDLATACPNTDLLHGITLTGASAEMDLMLDDIRFE